LDNPSGSDAERLGAISKGVRQVLDAFAAIMPGISLPRGQILESRITHLRFRAISRRSAVRIKLDDTDEMPTISTANHAKHAKTKRRDEYS
jgi:hypothetical protein